MLQKNEANPSGVKVERKKKSDSCHIPSDKEVRYALGEVKLQEPSGFCFTGVFFFTELKLTALSTIPTQDTQRWKKG